MNITSILLILSLLFIGDTTDDCENRFYDFFSNKKLKKTYNPKKVPKAILKDFYIDRKSLGDKDDSLRIGHGDPMEWPAVKLLFMLKKGNEYLVYVETGAIGHQIFACYYKIKRRKIVDKIEIGVPFALIINEEKNGYKDYHTEQFFRELAEKKKLVVTCEEI